MIAPQRLANKLFSLARRSVEVEKQLETDVEVLAAEVANLGNISATQEQIDPLVQRQIEGLKDMLLVIKSLVEATKSTHSALSALMGRHKEMREVSKGDIDDLLEAAVLSKGIPDVLMLGDPDIWDFLWKQAQVPVMEETLEKLSKAEPERFALITAMMTRVVSKLRDTDVQ